MKWQPSPRLLLLPALVALVALVGLRLRHRPEEPVTAAPGPTPAAFQWQRVPLLPAGNTALAARHPLRPPYPHPYRFLLNQPHKCRERAPFLVLLVATAPEDTGSRDCIRRTWGNESSVPGVSIVRLFLLGVHPVFADALAPVLHEENQEYGDLIQQDFLDTYNNLTLKTLMGMEWVSKHCPNATYVMKADADVFLNLSYLTRRLLTPPKTGFATGYVYRGTGPIRSKASKWFVPYEVYPDATYPPYCAGPAYVLSADVAAGVYAAAQTLPLVPMEDAFVGICLRALGVAVTAGPWGAFSVGRIPYEPCRFARAVMVHRYPPREVLALWPRFQEAQGGCEGD
ncbi:beta-1,3-galactosyltransferase 1-like [Pezoporus wallicus]|uniref:beta-1,3-galactosyltransferase 1-like n=1 Tax=Pezoporus wallicus TaxID=35540 RepID=UPI00254B8233|nr:beta-1,3-galactosyltransferase 1-like [Pezoporus wallicus]